LSLYNLAAGFPLPIILAILIHYIPFSRYRRLLQTIYYAPNFISTVVVASMAFILLSPSTGLVNHLLRLIGAKPIFFMAEAGWFRHIFVLSTVWQHTGVSAIIYLGVLTTIDPALHQSAMIDGAGKLKRIIHIDLPALMPTAIVLLIIAFGRIMSIGFDRAYLLQTPLNLSTSELLPTYIYKVGVLGAGAIPRYSFATAVGLFNSVVNLCLVVIMNQLARRFTESRLF
jgi:putative aldouronate transport system permease protein